MHISIHLTYKNEYFYLFLLYNELVSFQLQVVALFKYPYLLYVQKTVNKFSQPVTEFIPPFYRNLTGVEICGLQMYYQLRPISFCGERQAYVEYAKWLNKFLSPLIVANDAQCEACILVSCLNLHVLVDFIKNGSFLQTPFVV